MDNIIDISLGMYNKCTTYTNCIVEIWENTITGETSVGWHKTEDTEEIEN